MTTHDIVLESSSESIESTANLIASMRNSRGIKVSEISDADLALLLADAGLLAEYARWRPVIASIVFDTIADQAEYTWTEIGDVSGIDVTKCLWNGYHSSFEQWNTICQTFGIADWNIPSTRLVEQIGLITAEQYGAGSGYQVIPSGKLTLNPCPTESDLKVFVLYTKAYASVESIPAKDYDIFLDLVESKASERVVKNIAASAMAMKVKTPEYERDLGTQLGFWRKSGQEKMQSFIAKCQAGSSAAGVA